MDNADKAIGWAFALLIFATALAALVFTWMGVDAYLLSR